MNIANVRAVLKQVHCDTVPQQVRVNAPPENLLSEFADCLTNRERFHSLALPIQKERAAFRTAQQLAAKRQIIPQCMHRSPAKR